jgi:hypothetical protein
LLLPNSTCDPQLELLAVPAREKESHATLNDEAVKTVPHLAVAVSDAARDSLPDHLAPIAAHLKAVAIVFCISIISHEPQKCYVNRSIAKLKSLKMETKILPAATKNLYK